MKRFCFTILINGTADEMMPLKAFFYIHFIIFGIISGRARAEGVAEGALVIRVACPVLQRPLQGAAAVFC